MVKLGGSVCVCVYGFRREKELLFCFVGSVQKRDVFVITTGKKVLNKTCKTFMGIFFLPCLQLKVVFPTVTYISFILDSHSM